MLIQERNRATLIKAIEALPEYQPGPDVWAAVSEALTLETTEQEAFQQAIDALPRYAPPPQVWEAIVHDLATGKRNAPVKTGFRLRRRIVQASVAASLLLAAALAGKLYVDRPVTSVELSYSEEIRSDDLYRDDWNQDAASFDEVIRQYTSNPLLSEQPDFRNLREELDELNSAKQEIEQMMEQYGRDPDLIRQIGEIERERSEILKKIVVLI